jgi:hypothetical protein
LLGVCRDHLELSLFPLKTVATANHSHLAMERWVHFPLALVGSANGGIASALRTFRRSEMGGGA